MTIILPEASMNKKWHFAMNRAFLFLSEKFDGAARWCEGHAIRHRGRAVFEAIPPIDTINLAFHEPDPSKRLDQVRRAAASDDRVADALIAGFSAGQMIHDNPRPPDPKRIAAAEELALPCTMESQDVPVDDMEPWGTKRRCRCGEAIVGSGE